LEQAKLIDDLKFASWLVESRSRSRPRGKRLLLQELKAKGIPPAEISLDIDEKSLATQALQKKIRLWQNLPLREFKAKAYRFLASRGFSWDVIEPVIRNLYNDTHVNHD
jgi:regulatory protein